MTLNLPGKHYVRNALAAIALADELEIPISKTIDALKHFKGVGRRFETYKDLIFDKNLLLWLMIMGITRSKLKQSLTRREMHIQVNRSILFFSLIATPEREIVLMSL